MATARSQGFGAALGAAAALIGLSSYWGFTVDDALISARVARHLHDGAGYRFNPEGPVVDAVTPLGWALLLAPFAKTPLAALQAARILGAVCFLGVGALLGHQMGKLGNTPWRFCPLLLLALCAPLGAWAVAGMETGLIIALCTVAVLETPLAPYALFGAVFARPELLPWAFALQLGFAWIGPRRPAAVLCRAVWPWLAVALAACVRLVAFGSAAPLATLAKPTDWADGMRYLLGALLLSGPPLLLLGNVTRLSPRVRVLVVAAAIHFLAVGMAGGDWMPFFRLVSPVLPGMLLAAAALAEQSTRVANVVRLTVASLVCIAVLTTHCAAARGVMEQRLRLVRSLSGFVQPGEPIVTLDVGWVGAATTATIHDLSGVTDRQLASLPGGHTSKRLADDFLERRLERSASLVVVLLVAPDAQLREPWYEIPLDRVVERRLALQARKLQLAAESLDWLALRGTGNHYIAVRLRPVH